ncbi:hypothetical protein BSKO_05865 [Bryopsis sp. KO-2023]|nr:hypothetical protein BSKO_05865 [Bryopsis sp. KO-2023]
MSTQLFLFVLLLAVINAAERNRRPLLELAANGSVFDVRSVDDFKQALFLDSVTQINLFQDVWITEAEWKDFVVPVVAREVVVEPDKTLVDAGITPQLFTDGLAERVRIAKNGHILFKSIHGVDIATPRSVGGYTRMLPFFYIEPNQTIAFEDNHWNTEEFCSSLGGLRGTEATALLYCSNIHNFECQLEAREGANTVFVKRGGWNNAVVMQDDKKHFQGAFTVLNTTWDCGTRQLREWMSQEIPDKEHTVGIPS